MDELEKLKGEKADISTSIYKVINKYINDFEALDINDDRNPDDSNYLSNIRHSYLLNKDLKLIIRLDGHKYELSVPKDIKISDIDIREEPDAYSLNRAKEIIEKYSDLPLTFSNKQIKRLKKAMSKRLKILNSNIKHQHDIDSSKEDIDRLEKYLEANTHMNRERKINDLIED